VSAREIAIEEASSGEGLGLVLETIRAKGTLAYPAETMYGIGGDGLDREVAARIAAAKGSPPGKPFLLLLDDVDRWRQVAASLPPSAEEAARKHWPGPLTLLLPARDDCAAAYEGKVAVRVPDLEVVRVWVREAGRPLFSTSANRAGRAPVRGPEELRALFGERLDLLVTGPVFPSTGLPSTIVDATADPPRVLRRGAAPFP